MWGCKGLEREQQIEFIYAWTVEILCWRKKLHRRFWVRAQQSIVSNSKEDWGGKERIKEKTWVYTGLVWDNAKVKTVRGKEE